MKRHVLKDERLFDYFDLHPLLEPSQVAAFDYTLYTLSIMEVREEKPHLCSQAQFTEAEAIALLALLRSYPNFCPFEVILATTSLEEPTESLIAQKRQILHKAQDNGTWDMLLRPKRNEISRMRLKLHTLGIDVICILETGYMLKRRRV